MLMGFSCLPPRRGSSGFGYSRNREGTPQILGRSLNAFARGMFLAKLAFCPLRMNQQAMNAPLNDQFIKLMIDNLTTAVILVDHTLKIEYLNGSTENTFAISKSKLLDHPIELLLKNDQETLTILRNALLSGHPYTKREVCLSLPSRVSKWVDLSITPLFLTTKETKLLVEIHSIERIMRISRDESLFSTHQTTKALIKGMAHEIKNPLGGIRGAAQLLSKELEQSSLTEFTDVIIRETDRLKNLVDKMLGPRHVPHFQSINIHRVIEHALNLIEIEQKHSSTPAIKFNRDYDASLPEINADFEQLIQAILNILKNACEALNENNISLPNIQVKTRILRQYTINNKKHRLIVRIDVIDNGPGVPEALIENIFYPMISGRPNGTGLGLSISQTNIQQHQGIIECNSQLGHTQFSILLPLERHHD